MNLPEYHESNRVTVQLLREVVYSSDEKVWDLLLLHKHRVMDQLAGLGLIVIIDEHDGFAYVRQMNSEDELSSGYNDIPKLFRRKRLGYGASLLAVVLRDELRKHDEGEEAEVRAVVRGERLLEIWAGLVKEQVDEKKLRREFEGCLKQMQEVGFLKRIKADADDFEIRRILKARVSLQFLEELKGRFDFVSGELQGGLDDA